MDKHKAEELLKKYAQGLCTPEEKTLVESGFLHELKKDTFPPSEEEIEAASERMRAKVNAHVSVAPHNRTIHFNRRTIYSKISVAASILLLVCFSLYFYRTHQPVTSMPPVSQNQDIKPAGNKATLTLANGKKILLDDATSGKLAEEAGMVITKAQDGQLVYNFYARNSPEDEPNAERATYNTIETPIGGKYQVILADGSHIWLNSASSIRFPVQFTAQIRKVEITGEVYFEVAKNPAKPFQVAAQNQLIEVLGTHFNVNTYKDDNDIKTTLIEGSVAIQAGDNRIVLKPGEQSLVNEAAVIRTAAVDTEEVMAWKEGFFVFNNTPILMVIKQLERWYGVEFETTNLPPYKFNGKISRQVTVAEVLQMMEITSGITFKTAGRRIYMLK